MTSKAFLFLSLLLFALPFWSHAQEEGEAVFDEELPFDAVIQSEMGGKRMKFYGNTRFNFNQAYFSNWISGGESALTFLYGLDYNFNYSDRNGLVWDSNLLLSIGTTYISGNKFLIVGIGVNLIKSPKIKNYPTTNLSELINKPINKINFENELKVIFVKNLSRMYKINNKVNKK